MISILVLCTIAVENPRKSDHWTVKKWYVDSIFKGGFLFSWEGAGRRMVYLIIVMQESARHFGSQKVQVSCRW